jgi:hypothetical protein
MWGILFLLLVIADESDGAMFDTELIAAEIRQEAALPADSKSNRALPLAALWNTGWYVKGFSPAYQLKMIEKGHYLLPTFYLPPPWKSEMHEPFRSSYYERSIKRVARLRLPIAFVCTQWEKYLTVAPEYFYRKAENNPNVINSENTIIEKVSPFGPERCWREVGEMWTSLPLLQKLQTWYPDPPSVFFISNNEHDKIAWYEVEQSSRYLSLYGPGRNDNFKRKVIADGWIKLYRALQEGMIEALIAPKWKKNSYFIGYAAFGPRSFGKWKKWQKYALYTPGRIDPWPLAWDGASISYYVNNWSPRTDYTVMSPQIEAMNWVFMLKEARGLNPDFRLELSTWDGHSLKKANDKREYYTALGQTFTPDRYEGYVQFGMWLLRPSVVREFRGNDSVFTRDEPYFSSVVKSVDRVHINPFLKKFWKKGELVSNKMHKHPYQSGIPAEFSKVARWFLLNTSLDPKRPWALDSSIPIFSIALVIGKKPRREWLVYAHSPLKDYDEVSILIPDYKTIKLDTRPSGVFYHVLEEWNEKNIYQLNVQ